MIWRESKIILLHLINGKNEKNGKKWGKNNNWNTNKNNNNNNKEAEKEEAFFSVSFSVP